MSAHPPAMPHGELQELFPNLFFVTGTMRGEFFGSLWQFSRNMTVVREGDKLTLINAVRLDPPGLASLERLGKVVNVVQLGAMHGYDDAFYVERYHARFWALPGMPPREGLAVHAELTTDGPMPVSGCTLFAFQTTQLPEGILRLDREGGILVACDSLQNWVGPDRFFLDDTVVSMRGMGFFAPANLGPAWMHLSQPQAEDFRRLKELAFKHALCGHGVPLRDTAMQDYAATFKRVFDV